MKKVFIDGIRGCNPLVPYLPSSLFKGDLISYSSDYDILLKENLASKFQVDSKNVVLYSGSSYALDFLLQQKYDQVYLIEGDFFLNKELAQYYGQRITSLPCLNMENELTKALAYCADKKCLLLLPFVRGFDGKLTTPEYFIELAQQLSKISPKSLIAVDGAYMEFSEIDHNLVCNLLQEPNIIYIGTFSKAYGIAGYRVGYLLKPEGYRHSYPLLYNLPVISAKIANYLLTDGKFLQKSIRHNRREKKFLHKANLRLILTEGNRVLYPTPQAQELSDYLESCQILVRVVKYTNTTRAISYSIGTRDSNTYFLEKLHAWEIYCSKRHD